MAVTATCPTALPFYNDGNRKVTYTDITFDVDYSTGGEVVTPQQLRLSAIEEAKAQITVAANADDALGPHATAIVGTSNGLQQVLVKLWDKTPAELTADDDVSGCTVRVTAVGY